jgi:hypothetical protein
MFVGYFLPEQGVGVNPLSDLFTTCDFVANLYNADG